MKLLPEKNIDSNLIHLFNLNLFLKIYEMNKINFAIQNKDDHTKFDQIPKSILLGSWMCCWILFKNRTASLPSRSRWS